MAVANTLSASITKQDAGKRAKGRAGDPVA